MLGYLSRTHKGKKTIIWLAVLCHLPCSQGNHMKLLEHLGKSLTQLHAKSQGSTTHPRRVKADRAAQTRQKCPKTSIFWH